MHIKLPAAFKTEDHQSRCLKGETVRRSSHITKPRLQLYADSVLHGNGDCVKNET